MASYTEQKKETVKELIDEYTGKSLDNYIRADVKDVAIAKMDEGASAIDVADAVFDCITEKYCGDQVMSMMSQQICPKAILFMLRNEIISTLK